MPGVLAEVVTRINQDRVAPHSNRSSMLGEGRRGRDDVGHHVRVLHPVGTSSRDRTTRMGAHEPNAVRRGDLRQTRVDPAPRIVDEVGAFTTDHVGDLGTPGVHADHGVGMRGAHLADELRRTTYLFGRIDIVSGTGFDPPDVDDVGALPKRLGDGEERIALGVVGTLVIERVGGSVDDCHDRQVGIPEGSLTQPHRFSLRRYEDSYDVVSVPHRPSVGHVARSLCQGWSNPEALVPFVYIVAGLIVVVVIGLLAVGKLGELPDPTLDRAAVVLGEAPVDRAQIDRLHFSVGLRGYRMGEVDDVLDRVAGELSWRDDRIAELETTLAEHGVAVPDRVVDVVVADSDQSDDAVRSDDDVHSPVSAEPTELAESNLEESSSAE